MMLKELKDDLLDARKTRDKFLSGLLTVIVGDTELAMRRAGEKRDADTIALATVKKLIKDNTDIISRTEMHCAAHVQAKKENDYLKCYLPQLLSADEIRAEIDKLAPQTIPDAMKYFVQNFKGKVDNGLVKKLVIEYLK